MLPWPLQEAATILGIVQAEQSARAEAEGRAEVLERRAEELQQSLEEVRKAGRELGGEGGGGGGGGGGHPGSLSSCKGCSKQVPHQHAVCLEFLRTVHPLAAL